MATQNINMLPLSALIIDPMNVRKDGRNAVDPVLKASIKALGVRVPLNVRPADKEGFYFVVDGGRRLAALLSLREDDKSKADVLIPVSPAKENDAEAREVSLALNFSREAMSEVDEYRAFASLHYDKSNPQTVEAIARRFGITEKRVEQRLALGSLDDSILEAYTAGTIKAEALRAFTLSTSKKAQKDALAKLIKSNNYPNAYNVKQALGLTDASAGKFLALIGEDAYVKRGGKITRDLFGDDHVVSDPGLVKLMVDELVSAKVDELLKAGWKWAIAEIPGNDALWKYGRVNLEGKPTKAEAKRLKELEAICEDESDDQTQEAMDAASDEKDALQATIDQRAITPEIMKRAGVFVSVAHNGKAIELDVRTEPKAEKETPAAKKAAEKKKAERAAAPEDNVSQTLHVTLSETLTAAVQETIMSHPHVAMAALIAAVASRDSAVGIHPTASHSWNGPKLPDFAATLQSALKLTAAKQIEILTAHVSKAIKLVDYAQKKPAMDNASYVALASAVDGKKLTTAIREKFDFKNFFSSISRPTIVDAVREAMGDDHAATVAKMDKAAAAKFATANLPKTKWLPKQLRIAGYDGPAKKVKAKAPAKKKAKR